MPKSATATVPLASATHAHTGTPSAASASASASGRPSHYHDDGTAYSSRVNTTTTTTTANGTAHSQYYQQYKTHDVSIVKNRFILFDFSDSRAIIAAARFQELGARILHSIPDDYGKSTCPINSVWFMTYSSHSNSTNGHLIGENSSSSVASKVSSPIDSTPARPLPKVLSKRSKLLLKAAAVNETQEEAPAVNSPSLVCGQELALLAKARGIRVLSYHTLDKLLMKLGQPPLDLDFSLGSSRSSSSHPPKKRIKLSDGLGFYNAIEKVYNEKNSRLSVDEPPQTFLPALRKRKRKASKETNEVSPPVVQNAAPVVANPPPAQVQAQVEGQAPAQNKEKRQKVARDNMYCEVCAVKFSSIEEHVNTELHNRLQNSSPVWEALDDLYERCEVFQPGDSEEERFASIGDILFSHLEESLPMAYRFGVRILGADW